MGTWFSGSWDSVGLASKFAATERRHSSCRHERAQHQKCVPDCMCILKLEGPVNAHPEGRCCVKRVMVVRQRESHPS